MEGIRSEKDPEVSVVVPISERHDDMKKLYHLYADELRSLDMKFEFIFIMSDVDFNRIFKKILARVNSEPRQKLVGHGTDAWHFPHFSIGH